MNTRKLTLALILLGLFVVIVLQNTQVVTLRVFVWEISMSRIILLPLAMLVGFVLGYVTGRGTHPRR